MKVSYVNIFNKEQAKSLEYVNGDLYVYVPCTFPKLQKVKGAIYVDTTSVRMPELTSAGHIDINNIDGKLFAPKLEKVRTLHIIAHTKLLIENKENIKLLATSEYQLFQVGKRFFAGCRNFTKKQALKHWKAKLNCCNPPCSFAKRAKIFVRAIEEV